MTTETTASDEYLCACGHSKFEHAGRTHRGICYPCHGNGNSGAPGTYCSRYRKPVINGQGQTVAYVEGKPGRVITGRPERVEIDNPTNQDPFSLVPGAYGYDWENDR
jgi:hypothetical protein